MGGEYLSCTTYANSVEINVPVTIQNEKVTSLLPGIYEGDSIVGVRYVVILLCFLGDDILVCTDARTARSASELGQPCLPPIP